MSAMYVVQSFTKGRRGAILMGAPILARNTAHARSAAERLASRKAGVIAFVSEGDALTGEFEDPKLIAAFGDLPEEINDMERVQ